MRTVDPTASASVTRNSARSGANPVPPCRMPGPVPMNATSAPKRASGRHWLDVAVRGRGEELRVQPHGTPLSLEPGHKEGAHVATDADRVRDVWQMFVAIPLWILIPEHGRPITHEGCYGFQGEPQRLAEEDEVGAETSRRREHPLLSQCESDVATQPAVVDQQCRVAGSPEGALDAALDTLGPMAAENEDAHVRCVSARRRIPQRTAESRPSWRRGSLPAAPGPAHARGTSVRSSGIRQARSRPDHG